MNEGKRSINFVYLDIRRQMQENCTSRLIISRFIDVIFNRVSKIINLNIWGKGIKLLVNIIINY